MPRLVTRTPFLSIDNLYKCQGGGDFRQPVADGQSILSDGE
jgi:hypothetical protein